MWIKGQWDKLKGYQKADLKSWAKEKKWPQYWMFKKYYLELNQKLMYMKKGEN